MVRDTRPSSRQPQPHLAEVHWSVESCMPPEPENAWVCFRRLTYERNFPVSGDSRHCGVWRQSAPKGSLNSRQRIRSVEAEVPAKG